MAINKYLCFFCRWYHDFLQSEHVTDVANCLSRYCNWTGQNSDVFSKNTRAKVKADIKYIINMKELTKNAKYLGNLLCLGMDKIEAYNNLLKQVGALWSYQCISYSYLFDVFL